jgi:transcriptional regulator with XRE-family HTH domain
MQHIFKYFFEFFSHCLYNDCVKTPPNGNGGILLYILGGYQVEQLDKQIGEKLKHLREQKNLTQREVAEKIDIDYSYISKIENGKVPSLDKLNKLCDLYGVKVSSLFGEEMEPDDGLKKMGVEWIAFSKEMDQQNVTPEELKKVLDTLKLLKKL